MAFTHWVDVAFFIEKELTEENSLPGLLQKQNRQYKTHLLIGALMMDEPLLPISRSDLSLYGGMSNLNCCSWLTNFRRDPTNENKATFGADTWVTTATINAPFGSTGNLLDDVSQRWRPERIR
ncbi:hypothetical protein M408DRAFT_162855 [Serendipita vermifera MAFF 305830]|uniref:Uncharacterized protein n=1 Tax=Serendipita vermifera MAFF 305830 TaxID=933852 RepID=A0A0C3ASZ6_SERVB|nr:hypothetical protein M408DRAFT_162855 [Serendipita vermifera MAFF 305830]